MNHDHIPTLTNIVQNGDPEMLNHFDPQHFSEENDGIEIPETLENSYEESDHDITDIPSVQLDTDSLSELPEQDFSLALDNEVKNNLAEEELESSPDNSPLEIIDTEVEDNNVQQLLKEKIDSVINKALPEIEQQLRHELYKAFDVENTQQQ